ncbi:MAG: GNAT family N-acetyltransferase [Chthoniobacterales bacterium]|nr:GNAT family N-acetyltransferase [Chthoniobacterales bacterium]
MNIETDRLLLRGWKKEDAQAYYQMNQDPKVLEFLPGPLSREQVEQFITDKNQTLQETGYTLWAVEEKATKALLGFIGLQEVLPPFPILGIEVGWRLDSQYWGRGYAPEGAQAVLTYGFQTLGFQEIFSYTSALNKRSQRVMEKIGMTYLPEGDFAHPKLPEDHLLSKHVIYGIKKGVSPGIPGYPD